MAKRYTAKQVSEILRFVLLGAFEHMEAIKREIRAIGPVTDQSSPESLARAKVMHLTLTCINDIVHPAHRVCYSLFDKDNHEFFDNLIKSYAVVKEKNLVPECFCITCDPDKSKSIAKMEEINALKEKPSEDRPL